MATTTCLVQDHGDSVNRHCMESTASPSSLMAPMVHSHHNKVMTYILAHVLAHNYGWRIGSIASGRSVQLSLPPPPKHNLLREAANKAIELASLQPAPYGICKCVQSCARSIILRRSTAVEYGRGTSAGSFKTCKKTRRFDEIDSA